MSLNDFTERFISDYIKIDLAPKFPIQQFLFKEQLALAMDPAKFATAVCSVRAGKTLACAADLIYTALTKPKTVGLYITLARSSAKRIVWPELHAINRTYGLGGTPNESDLSFRFPNHSIIYCSGASDSSEIEKFRGLSNVALAYIDECFHPETQIETDRGLININTIKIGDRVKNATGYGRVKSISCKIHDKYIELKYNGKTVKCSMNHLFFTSSGWVKAKDLRVGDLLARQTFCLRLLQKGIHQNSPWQSLLPFLHDQLWSEVSALNRQSYGQSKDAYKNETDDQKNRAQTFCSQRQWYGTHKDRSNDSQSYPRSFMELCGWAWQMAKRLSQKLQARFVLSFFKAWDRNRWTQSSFQERSGSEERIEAQFIRLDSTSVQESRSDPTNRAGLFYDIGVEDHPSFTVAGALVHNCQAFRSHIKELVEEILIKRLYDTNGRLRLIGTPGPIPAGYFYDSTHSNQWSHHAWTLHANPYIEKKAGCSVEALIAQDCARKGVTLDDASIQRECFGRWVLDLQTLLLEYNPEKNDFHTLPAHAHFTYLLGMDFGFEDADAFAVIGWQGDSPNTYLVDEIIAHKSTYEDMVKNFDQLYHKYPFSKVIADPGGGGKKLIESLRVRYPIPMETADKLGKIANYGILSNALKTGRFFAKKSSRFAQDCNLLERDLDRSTPDRTIVRGHSDIVDAVLYAFHDSPAYTFSEPPERALVGSPQWAKEEEEAMRQRLFSQIQKEQEEARQIETDMNLYG